MYLNLSSGKYHLYIDSEFCDGSMSIGELIVPGRTEDEVLISTYSCHPAMANDNCSSLALLAELARYICGLKSRRYTYRLLLAPETTGAIAYLSSGNNLERMKKHVKAGFVFLALEMMVTILSFIQDTTIHYLKRCCRIS